MGKRDRDPAPPPGPARPFNDAFAKLRALGDTAAAPPDHAPVPPPPASPPPGPARAVVRMERKGRGGKEATAIEKLGLPPRTLEAWALEAKRALGCGGAVEGDAIVLQGDQRDRAARWLEGKGVRKVVRG